MREPTLNTIRLAPEDLPQAIAILKAGGVVAFPTDTVYALAASLSHPAALARIIALKGRPTDKPLPVLLAAAADLAQVAQAIDERIVLLLDRFWPGPLTIVVPARVGMPAAVLGPGQTIGARVPDHALARELIERAGGAIAATSANRSGEPPAVTAADVASQVGGIDLLLDGGRAPGGVASTVIAVAPDRQLIVLREGAIPTESLVAAWD